MALSPTHRSPTLQGNNHHREPATSPRSHTDYVLQEDEEDGGRSCFCCCRHTSNRENVKVTLPSPPRPPLTVRSLIERVRKGPQLDPATEYNEAMAMVVSPRSPNLPPEPVVGAVPSEPSALASLTSPREELEATLAHDLTLMVEHVREKGYTARLPNSARPGRVLSIREQQIYDRDHPRFTPEETKAYLEKELIAAKSYRPNPLGFKYKEAPPIHGIMNRNFHIPGFEIGIGMLSNDFSQQKTYGLSGQKKITMGGQETTLTYFIVLEEHAVGVGGYQKAQSLSFLSQEFMPSRGGEFATELELNLRCENAAEINETNILNALTQTCAKLNDQLAEHQLSFHDQSGCVMGMALFLLDRVWFVNMGHTRIILRDGKTGETIQVTEDAHASLPRDLEEITKKRGGTLVVTGEKKTRINGVVPTSRAFGYPNEKGVIPLPKITSIPLSEIGSNSFLILATHHFWEMGTPQEVGQAIGEHCDLPTWQLVTNLTESANGWHEVLHRPSFSHSVPKSRTPEMTLIGVKINPSHAPRPFQMPITSACSARDEGPD